MELTRELALRLLSYDRATGRLHWRERDPDLFEDKKISAASAANIWNAKYAGKLAFDSVNGDGYRTGSFRKKEYRAHRVIFLMMTGRWPEEVFHLNKNRADNRWDNLRERRGDLDWRVVDLAQASRAGFDLSEKASKAAEDEIADLKKLNAKLARRNRKLAKMVKDLAGQLGQ